jgi:hypothetical protein
MAEERTLSYYRIDFTNCGLDYDYTICKDWTEVLEYLHDVDFDDPDASVKIAGVEMTEAEYGEFVAGMEEDA